MAIVALFFIIWDILFTHLGIWSFNSHYVIGYYFYNLPIEEVCFFIFIPYSCLFTYYCFSIFIKPQLGNTFAIALTWLLALILVLGAIYHIQQLYTSVTFLLLAALLSYLAINKASFLPVFYIAFIANLLPFFLSNGILTGSWIDQPVVWYNNSHNLQIRLGTIPMEDVFYGMLLQLANTTGFWLLQKRKAY